MVKYNTWILISKSVKWKKTTRSISIMGGVHRAGTNKTGNIRRVWDGFLTSRYLIKTDHQREYPAIYLK